ncbi:MAG: Fic family protein [Verrucomicrobiae bacterium]|nr:Fic family protein [Verrucomicrobiae bacterium]
MGPGAGEHGLRGRTGEPETPGGTPPDRDTRFVETTRGILSDAELAPFLGERVLACEEAIVTGAFADRPLDEHLLLEFHRRIAGDLVHEWADRWRAIEVQVGNLRPPPPYRLPHLLWDYAAGLSARWGEVFPIASPLTLETLAFAEGRPLTLHPFVDFNGRGTRLRQREILHRALLPQVELAATGETNRNEYFAALEAAGRRDWQPLSAVWQRRFEQLPPPPTSP